MRSDYKSDRAESLTAIAIVIVNSHSQLNIVFRISNAYTQYGQIANPAEQSALSEECGRYEKGNNEI